MMMDATLVAILGMPIMAAVIAALIGLRKLDVPAQVRRRSAEF